MGRTGGATDPLLDRRLQALLARATCRRAGRGSTVLDVRYRLGGAARRRPSTPPGTSPGRRTSTSTDDLAGRARGRGGRHPLPDPDRPSRRRCAAPGVRDDRPVVVYDDWAGPRGRPGWWLLRDPGTPTCGCSTAAGRPGSRPAARSRRRHGRAPPRPATSRPGPGRCRSLDADERARGRRGGVLVDARAPERFRGEVEPVDPVAGHVPGAVNVPTGDQPRAPTGRFRPAARAARAVRRGVGAGRAPTWRPTAAPASPPPTTCSRWRRRGSAPRSTPGSWSEWVADASRPVGDGALRSSSGGRRRGRRR